VELFVAFFAASISDFLREGKKLALTFTSLPVSLIEEIRRPLIGYLTFKQKLTAEIYSKLGS